MSDTEPTVMGAYQRGFEAGQASKEKPMPFYRHLIADLQRELLSKEQRIAELDIRLEWYETRFNPPLQRPTAEWLAACTKY